MIAKEAVEGKSMNNTKGGTRSEDEFKKQFQSKKPAKPLDWAQENQIREKQVKENKKEII